MNPITWPDAPRLIAYIHNNPEQVATALAAMLTQEQVDILHAQLFPPLTNPLKARIFRGVRTSLLRAGYESTAPPVKWTDEEMAALAVM